MPSGLIYAEQGKAIEHPGVYLLATIRHYADYHLISKLNSAREEESKTATFFQASTPQVWEFLREHR